jgi:hypothetical protein
MPKVPSIRMLDDLADILAKRKFQCYSQQPGYSKDKLEIFNEVPAHLA